MALARNPNSLYYIYMEYMESKKKKSSHPKEKYTIIIPSHTKERISSILENFDFFDMGKWHDRIRRYVKDPFGGCWLGSEDCESRINSIFKYFQFLDRVDLLGNLYDYYINNIVTENEWYIILSSYNNCTCVSPDKQGDIINTLEPEPQSEDICDATIRNLIIKDIDIGRLKVHPAGKINDNGELVFFEYEGTPVIVENSNGSLEDIMINGMSLSVVESLNASLVSGIQKLAGN